MILPARRARTAPYNYVARSATPKPAFSELWAYVRFLGVQKLGFCQGSNLAYCSGQRRPCSTNCRRNLRSIRSVSAGVRAEPAQATDKCSPHPPFSFRTIIFRIRTHKRSFATADKSCLLREPARADLIVQSGTADNTETMRPHLGGVDHAARAWTTTFSEDRLAALVSASPCHHRNEYLEGVNFCRWLEKS